MRAPATSRIIRALIVPIGAVPGLFASQLLMPSAEELRRAGQIVDGTGYGSAGILGLFGGAFVGYIVRTILDHKVWRSAKDHGVDRAG